MRYLALLWLFFVGSASSQETIKIGVITDRVGVSKPYSEPATEGVVFGAEEINRKGGVLGRKIELLIEDDSPVPTSPPRSPASWSTRAWCSSSASRSARRRSSSRP